MRAILVVLLLSGFAIAQPATIYEDEAPEWVEMPTNTTSHASYHEGDLRFLNSAPATGYARLQPGLTGTHEIWWFHNFIWDSYGVTVSVDGQNLTSPNGGEVGWVLLGTADLTPTSEISAVGSSLHWVDAMGVTAVTTSGGGEPTTELEALVAIWERLGTANFLLQACGTCLALIWGGYTWRLIVLAKNQRSIW